jgi:hypothetical protein
VKGPVRDSRFGIPDSRFNRQSAIGDWRLAIGDWRQLPIADYRLPINPLPIADYPSALPIADGFAIINWLFPIAYFPPFPVGLFESVR